MKNREEIEQELNDKVKNKILIFSCFADGYFVYESETIDNKVLNLSFFLKDGCALCGDELIEDLMLCIDWTKWRDLEYYNT